MRTIGFTPSQVTRTIVWQATTVAVLASVVGIPVGVVLGRLGWRALADQLGIVNHPATPLVAILVAVPAAVVFANLVALVPGRRASRMKPGAILRAE